MDSIKTLYLLGDHSSQQKEKAEKLIKKCEKEIDSVINKYLNQIFVLKEDKLKLELTPEKQTYTAGEEIKLALKVANVLKTPIYFLNDTEGTRGPDAGIFKNGILIRRIKAGLVKNLPPSELVGKLITIKPGESFETSITILPGNRNTEGEYDILASYDGGEAFLGFEKGWIRNILLSERIKIKTDR